ncbi:unnamed protein product [Mytilus coruscus]|uniref:Uncharacterized protein n=1 Tax=Mytilus coruscus TaxID=42192 RepID=A0A6J8EX68_MYTCO|nr:unnamed protein product [Mytilus coruscus]
MPKKKKLSLSSNRKYHYRNNQTNTKPLQPGLLYVNDSAQEEHVSTSKTASSALHISHDHCYSKPIQEYDSDKVETVDLSNGSQNEKIPQQIEIFDVDHVEEILTVFQQLKINVKGLYWGHFKVTVSKDTIRFYELGLHEELPVSKGIRCRGIDWGNQAEHAIRNELLRWYKKQCRTCQEPRCNVQPGENYKSCAVHRPTEDYKSCAAHRPGENYKSCAAHRPSEDYKSCVTHRLGEDYKSCEDYQSCAAHRPIEDYKSCAAHRPIEDYKSCAAHRPGEEYKSCVAHRPSEEYKSQSTHRPG